MLKARLSHGLSAMHARAGLTLTQSTTLPNTRLKKQNFPTVTKSSLMYVLPLLNQEHRNNRILLCVYIFHGLDGLFLRE